MKSIFDMQSSDYDNIVDETGFEPQRLQVDQVDQHFAALDDEQRIRARCSVWWRDTAGLDGATTGAIGHYAATDAESGAAVLQPTSRSGRWTATPGGVIALLPKEATPGRSSWSPTIPTSGQVTSATSVSRRSRTTYRRSIPIWHIASRNSAPCVKNSREKFDRLGVQIEPLDVANPVDDMAGIYQVVCESFKDAFMYTPLDVDCYCSMYEPLLQQVDPRLMLVAKHDGEVVGFMLAPPDFLQLEYQNKMDAIVLKTVAVLPREEYSGLGRVLIVDLLKNAVEMGFTTAISALMHTKNRSQKVSSECAGPMRAYTLFAKEL
jgi:L-amino acid N-acyltransferase YncA